MLLLVVDNKYMKCLSSFMTTTYYQVKDQANKLFVHGIQEFFWGVYKLFFFIEKFLFKTIFKYPKTWFSVISLGPSLDLHMYSREVQFICGISIHLVTWCTNGFMDGWVKIAERTLCDVYKKRQDKVVPLVLCAFIPRYFLALILL